MLLSASPPTIPAQKLQLSAGRRGECGQQVDRTGLLLPHEHEVLARRDGAIEHRELRRHRPDQTTSPLSQQGRSRVERGACRAPFLGAEVAEHSRGLILAVQLDLDLARLRNLRDRLPFHLPSHPADNPQLESIQSMTAFNA